MRIRGLAKLLLTAGIIAILGNGMTAFADTVKVNASNLNFRASASMNADVIRMLPRGTVLERTENLGEWSKVTVDGVTGYAASRYLQEVTSIVTALTETTITIPGKEAISGLQIIRDENKALTSWDTVYASEAWMAGLKSEYAYAANSKINSGQAIFYKTNSQTPKNRAVCVNAGHGTKGGSSVKTLCHPDGSPKVTGGTTAAGATTAVAVSSGMTFNDGTQESAVTLKMAKILRDKLLAEGYDVLMIRETDDVQLDNVARTVLANNLADCHLALHWDSTTKDKGCFYMSVPSNDSYRSMEPVKSNWESHNRLGDCLIEGLRAGGNKIFSSGAMEMDLTQTSYSTIPSVDIELGDKASSHSQETLEKLANGLVTGVNRFFEK
ncbi:MAG: N-acetylmuramoyl-L-alanine amidase [Lachnospiraceae bacterium]|nr:N-acetylmuramoyl-L-alanine amidase [Lachnospiraceae bacterium]